MTLKLLTTRLVLAVVVPVVLVTATLYPIFRAHLEARLNGMRNGAEAMLEAGHEVLLQGMNESLNHVLATAEMPILKHYVNSVNVAQSPVQEAVAESTQEQLEALFSTLLTHYGRYTELTLIDTSGQELLRATHQPLLSSFAADPASAAEHADAEYFQEAMLLAPRDLYVSPPAESRLDQSVDGDMVPIVEIATPVFSESGVRQGVLLFRLDWRYLTAGLRQVMDIDGATQAVLVDSQGAWLLPEREGPFQFGDDLTGRSPALWDIFEPSYHGEAELGHQWVIFRSHDIRTLHYRSQAGMITSQSGYHPWRLGVLVPKPSLGVLLSQETSSLLVILLLYVLSIAFGGYWAISHYRLHMLRRQAQTHAIEARQQAREVRDLYENAPCGYHSLDADGRVVKINRTELDWLGYRAEEVISKSEYRDFITPETREAFDAAFQGVLGPAKEGTAECELLTKSGDTRPVVIKATAYANHHGFIHSRAMVFDLTERKQMEEVLARQAMTDPLTGLGNRRYLQDQAAMEMARAQRGGEPLSLIAIDLDRFKLINDNYGHDVGDLVLQSFAQTAQEILREGDVLCRMGGEEFAVLLPATTQEQAMLIAERLRQQLEAFPVEVGTDITDDGWLHYTASLGVTLVKAAEPSLKPAIKRADQGLYEAKEQGRNRVQWRAA